MNSDPSNDSDMESDAQTYAASLQSDEMMDTDDATNAIVDSHLWGYLQPCNAAKLRIDFWRLQACVSLGRNLGNQIVLEGPRISMQHCTITWDGKDGDSNVVVRDCSTNGTFINGVKLGRDQTRIIRDGNEIAFGSSVPQLANNGAHDYRYIYRHVANARKMRGLFAEYDLGTLLGRGAFGSVHRALHRPTGKWYAVKMIDSSKIPAQDGKSGHEKVVREISIMEGLNHPNICKIHETFFEEVDNTVNLVLEFVDNGDLWDYVMASRSGLSEMRTKDIIYQICDAMEYVHGRGITHRDLKPENILLTSDNFPIVKVADFGLSKVVDRMTMLRSFCGTPIYLAPEVVNSNVSRTGYDNRVDSFSVGGIVHLCLTKKEPFVVPQKSLEMDAAVRVKTRKRNMSGLNNKDITANAINFIQRLLEENPRRRPSMAEALAHPWLADYEPQHGLVTRTESDTEEPAGSDTEEDTARENDDDDQEGPHTRTRAMTRAQTQRVKGKGKAAGTVRILGPLVEEGSSASGSSLDADTDMRLVTPVRGKGSAQAPDSPSTSVRRSQRTNKGVPRP